MRRYLEPNANENAVYQNVWAASTMVLRRNFIALYVYIKKKGDRLKISGSSSNARCWKRKNINNKTL